MGQPSAEQTVMIIDSVSDAIANTHSNPNYWWLLCLAIVPPIVIVWVKRKIKRN